MNPEIQTETQPHVKKLDVDSTPLNNEEKIVFDHYKNAVLVFSQVFDAQLKMGFYPEVDDELIRSAAEKDSRILDHYSVVTKGVDGVITSIPYSIAYADAAQGAIRSLRSAIDSTTDPEQKKYLEVRARVLLTGEYKDAEKLWIQREKEPLVDIAIGFYEIYLDNRFNTKYAAMAWTGIKDVEKTDTAQQLADRYLESYPYQGKRVKTRVEKVALLSGLIADAPAIPSATSLPNQKEWRDEIGTKIIFFENVFEKAYEDSIPLFRKLTDEARDFTDDEIKELGFKMLVAHESFHPAIRRENDSHRLGSEFTFVQELLCDILAQKISWDLSGDLVTEKELKIALPLLVTKALNLKNKGMPLNNPYMKGWATALNFMIENGGVKVEGGKLKMGSDEDTRRGIQMLTAKLEDIAKDGTEQDAVDLQEKYANTVVFDQFVTP